MVAFVAQKDLRAVMRFQFRLRMGWQKCCLGNGYAGDQAAVSGSLVRWESAERARREFGQL
jgi:hypothetical protein